MTIIPSFSSPSGSLPQKKQWPALGLCVCRTTYCSSIMDFSSCAGPSLRWGSLGTPPILPQKVWMFLEEALREHKGFRWQPGIVQQGLQLIIQRDAESALHEGQHALTDPARLREIPLIYPILLPPESQGMGLF